MYCKYCQKLLPDGAKFCGFCGKDQTTVNENNVEKSDPRAGMFNFLSICINVVLIILTFTGLFTVNIGSSYYSKSIEISMASFFDGSDFISAYNMGFSEMEEMQAILILAGSVILIAIIICICYYIFYISRFSFLHSEQNSNYKNYCRFTVQVRKYNTLAMFIFIIVTSWELFIMSCALPEGMSDYVSVSPSPTLITIYILTGIQWIMNRFD